MTTLYARPRTARPIRAPESPLLARAITWKASKQTYLTVRFLVDRDRVADAYRAYAYFRWLDDRLDAGEMSAAECAAFVRRQQDYVERLYAGDALDLGDGVTLVRLGGHFTGGTVLHWAGGADGRGAVLSGDILAVASDRRYVSFMYSFPNYIPLPASEVRRIREAIEPYTFDRIYGAWWGRVVHTDAKEAVRRSADRYIRAIAG